MTTAAPFVSGVRTYMLRMQRRHAVPVLVLPLVGTIALFAWRWQPSTARVSLFAAFYLVSMLGITVGYHRLLTHGSFRCAAWVRAAFAIMGSLAAEGSPTFWVANHRLHHQYSDGAGDPHSPLRHRSSLRDRVTSFIHAHVAWMFTELPADPLKYAPDLLRDPAVKWVNQRYLVWVIGGLLLPGALGACVLGGASGFLDGFLWGGLFRVFVAQHVTWCINSVCHVFGSRPYVTGDGSRNNALLGILALGEGWHNNHHADPTSARHGFHVWQVDVSYWFIRLLAAVGMVHGVRDVNLKRLERLRVQLSTSQADSR